MSKKVKDTTLAKTFGMSSASVGRYRKDKAKKRILYEAMLAYHRKSIGIQFYEFNSIVFNENLIDVVKKALKEDLTIDDFKKMISEN